MTRRVWDAMDDDVLRVLHANGRGVRWIARFMCVDNSTIHRRARRLDVVFDARHRWTAVEDAALHAGYPDQRAADVARALGLRIGQVHQRAAKLGLHKSAAFMASDRSRRVQRGKQDPRMRATQFKPGLVPHNKGLRRPGWAPGRVAETQFKKGRPACAARNYVPIGTERNGTDDYLERKVTDDPTLVPARRWVGVHRLVWEAAHGAVSRGHIVVFRRERHTTVEADITIDRLECISRAENMRRNSVHRYPPELACVMQLRGALNRKIHHRERKQ